jgi:hypothetical protein
MIEVEHANGLTEVGVNPTVTSVDSEERGKPTMLSNGAVVNDVT